MKWVNDNKLEFSPDWNSNAPTLTVNAKTTKVTIHSQTITGISHAYHEAQRGEILAQVDSNGFLEIGANQDDAAQRLDVQVGDKVMLRLSE